MVAVDGTLPGHPAGTHGLRQAAVWGLNGARGTRDRRCSLTPPEAGVRRLAASACRDAVGDRRRPAGADNIRVSEPDHDLRFSPTSPVFYLQGTGGTGSSYRRAWRSLYLAPTVEPVVGKLTPADRAILVTSADSGHLLLLVRPDVALAFAGACRRYPDEWTPRHHHPPGPAPGQGEQSVGIRRVVPGAQGDHMGPLPRWSRSAGGGLCPADRC